MDIRTIKGIVKEKIEVALRTYAIKIVNSEGGVFDFKPGQFVTLNVAPNTKRSYSIGSLPGKEFIELTADTWRGGPGSQFFDNVKVDDIVEFLFPLGNFYYQGSDRPAYFFATGSGLVPFMSMLEYALTVANTQREMNLYAGFRKEEDIFGKGFFEMLDVRYENFIFKLNLTQPPEGYQGNIGRITEYIDTLPSFDIDAYICGSNEMVSDIKERLVQKGVDPTHIYHEMYY